MIDSSVLFEEDIKELLLLTKQNNIMLKEILSRLRNMDCTDSKIKQYATNFGLSICSTIVGDRILGLGRNNQ